MSICQKCGRKLGAKGDGRLWCSRCRTDRKPRKRNVRQSAPAPVVSVPLKPRPKPEFPRCLDCDRPCSLKSESGKCRQCFETYLPTADEIWNVATKAIQATWSEHEEWVRRVVKNQEWSVPEATFNED